MMLYFTLTNTDLNLDNSGLDKRAIYEPASTQRAGGLYDFISTSNEDIFAHLLSIRKTARTSNNVVVHKVVRNIKSANALLFIESKMGCLEVLVESMLAEPQITGIYLTRGTHDLVIASDSSEALKERVTYNPTNNQMIRTNMLIEPENTLCIPEHTPVMSLNGRNYQPAKNNRVVDYSDIVEYAEACFDMAKSIQTFNPTLIYAPLRGAKPITDVCLEAMDCAARSAVFYPVTASFVDGRKINSFELRRLKRKKPELCERIAYIDEVNSGSMLRGHGNEIIREFKEDIEAEKTKIKFFGLANQHGNRITAHLKKHVRRWHEVGILEIFPVKSLFTMDQCQTLGIHFLDYSLGPHVVPFINRDYTYPEGHNRAYEIFRETIHKNS